MPLTNEGRSRGGKRAAQLHRNRADEFAKSFRPLLEHYPPGKTFHQIAKTLNEKGVKTYRGNGKWKGEQVQRIAKRLGITHLGVKND
jgi:hypothetical protein